ncbi:MAG: hypothetical protein JXM69_13875 [Anaerolineae bacterium]|nr:hypothetical protein [Anaerolineae bacterium]
MTTATVEKIAIALNETTEIPLAEIERVVNLIGEERALTILDETLKVEAEGGMLTDDGQRRRTPGGVFFKLVKNQTTPKERGKIFGARPGAGPKLLPVSWEESEQLSNKALELPKGEISKVKITIIGRPGRIIEKGPVVITSMQNSKPPNLPKGLPKPPGDPTTYVVYIAMKQWLNVKDSINENPDDVLIIDGYPVFDKRIGQSGAMTIFAQNVTSKLIQQARRETQRTGAKKG